MSSSSHLSEFLERARKPHLPGEDDFPINEGAYPRGLPESERPEVVFQGPALRLNRHQEQLMIAFALDRQKEMENEMGYHSLGQVPSDPGRFMALNEEWMLKRELYDKLFNQDVEWRSDAYPSPNIYESQNITLPTARTQVQNQISRVHNYFLKTDPWFSARPRRQVSQEIAELQEHFLKFKAEQSELKTVLGQAIDRIFINGEAVLKGTYKVDDDIYEDEFTVAVDPATREPLTAEDGDYIFDDDIWVALHDPETGDLLNADLQPIADNSEIVYVLERSPMTLKPEDLVWETQLVRRQKVHYEGADVDLVPYQNFFCPLQAKSVDTANCVLHVYDEAVADLVQRHMRGTEGAAISDPRFLEMVESMAGADGTPKAHSGMAGDRMDETDLNQGSPVVKVGEFYMRLDVFGTGEEKEIMLVMDLTNNRPIYYDYTARVTADGRRPFRVIRVNPVENRWYGCSQVGLFWGLQELIDLSINRMNKSQSDSGGVDFFNPDGVYEGDNNPFLRFNDNHTYTLKKDYKAEDVIQRVYLTDIKHDYLLKIVEIAQQYAQSLGGVANANDSQMAGLDTAKLATGIRHIERAGQEMIGPLIDHLIPGFQHTTEMFAKITVANLSQKETFTFFKDGSNQFEEMEPASIRDFEYTIKINLTTYMGEQELVQTQAAIDAWERFMAYPAHAQAVIAPLFERLFNTYQIPDPEQYFQPIPDQPIPGQAGDMMTGDPEMLLPQANRPELTA